MSQSTKQMFQLRLLHVGKSCDNLMPHQTKIVSKSVTINTVIHRTELKNRTKGVTVSKATQTYHLILKNNIHISIHNLQVLIKAIPFTHNLILYLSLKHRLIHKTKINKIFQNNIALGILGPIMYLNSYNINHYY